MPSPSAARTWTDEQLELAVESQTTWKGVASRLGLAQSSSWKVGIGRRPYVLDATAGSGRTWCSNGCCHRPSACPPSPFAEAIKPLSHEQRAAIGEVRSGPR